MQSPQAPTPVLITLTPSQVDIAPGSSPAEMAVSVRNGGPTVDQYGIEVEGLESGWYALDVQSLSLFPGDSFDGKLTLRVPPGSRPVAGAYPFTVHVRSRSNPEVSGAARGLARVGQGAAVRAAQAGRGRRSLWPLLLLASVAVVVLAVVAYLVLGNPGGGASRAGASLTPSPTSVVAQNILPTSTLPPLAAAASPTVEASATPLVQATVCGTWAIDHRTVQDTRFPPGITDHGPFQVAGQQYKYKADYTSVLYVNATGVISTVKVPGLDVFKANQDQPEVISATLVSATNIRVPLFVWACNPGSLVSLHVNLDDNAKTGIPYSCSENMAGTYKPDGASLSALKDQPAQGNWVLEMSVYSNEERPTSYFNSWGLAICTR
jgi:hypothetical protein